MKKEEEKVDKEKRKGKLDRTAKAQRKDRGL